MAKSKKPRKIHIIAMAAILALLSLVKCISSPSDEELRGKVMKLTSPHGSCSGEQIRGPSGVDYILTAAHCRVLEANGQIHVKTEDGREMDRRVIAEDPNADLLLLEGVPGLKGLDIASNDNITDHVRTFTHGNGLPTYKTDGVLVEERYVDVAISMAISPEDEAACTAKAKYIVSEGMCIMHVEGVITTAMVVPGSSGGPALSDSGELIGVVSAGNDHFSIMVPLHVIHSFIDNY